MIPIITGRQSAEKVVADKTHLKKTILVARLRRMESRRGFRQKYNITVTDQGIETIRRSCLEDWKYVWHIYTMHIWYRTSMHECNGRQSNVDVCDCGDASVETLLFAACAQMQKRSDIRSFRVWKLASVETPRRLDDMWKRMHAQTEWYFQHCSGLWNKEVAYP